MVLQVVSRPILLLRTQPLRPRPRFQPASCKNWSPSATHYHYTTTDNRDDIMLERRVYAHPISTTLSSSDVPFLSLDARYAITQRLQQVAVLSTRLVFALCD